MRHLFITIGCSLFLFACQPSIDKQADADSSSQEESADVEAREDSLELARAYARQASIQLAIQADVETKMIKAAAEDDAADDPAIWIHPSQTEKSLVFGSNKRGGLAVYDLSGQEIAYYPIGNINNVDIVNGFPKGDSTVTVLGCSNRSDQSIDLFSISPTDGKLTDIAAGPLKIDAGLIDDIYGFCFATDRLQKKYYAIINGKNGLMQQFEMTAKDGKIELALKRSVQFDSQTEGMVADDELGFLYVGEEGHGIWKLSLVPDSNTEKQLIKGSDVESNPNIAYDIEGLTLYKKESTGYLMASSQGNFSYALFERTGNNKYLTSFKIIDSPTIDGVEETDGLDVISDSLNEDFPRGLLVLQDGFNFKQDTMLPQNFKYVSWKKIEEKLTPPD